MNNLTFRKIFVLPIKFYKKCISPFLPNACRFYPTCSEYFLEAVLKHGVVKGSFLGVKRILRCNPFCEGGIDYVPENF